MSKAAVEIWKDQIEKLIRWAEKHKKTDHQWRVKTWDEEDIVHVSERYYGIDGDVPVILAEDETRIKPRVRWESRRDTLTGFCGMKDAHKCRLGPEAGSEVFGVVGRADRCSSRAHIGYPALFGGLDYCEHFFSKVGGMTGYERNYDFAGLINFANGLNRLASMEYGEEKVVMGRGHAKQQTIWGKLHPLSADENEPDLADFTGLRIDDEFIAALKEGLQEAQNPMILLNMAPHTGVRNQVWWKTPWVTEMELGLFQRGSKVAPDPVDNEGEGFEGELPNSNAVGDLWDLAFPVQREGSDSEQEDGVDDLTILGHETRHVMSEVLQQISSEDQEVKKYDPMVVYDGHAIYKATLVIRG
ncbi:hypothetical protein R1sor_004706 [Riccia sorocarpa]|uniref:Uncharacterized protein n=1 Tax=Riccia sorocarpa TaxID=122646 RepID=A0ABD3HLT6_9MARC